MLSIGKIFIWWIGQYVVNNGNKTEWSLIQSVIIPVNNKLKQLPSSSPIC